VVDLYLTFDDDDDWADMSGPPAWLAIVNLVLVAVALACHIPGSRSANWVGYFTGAWVIPVMAIVFYATDRERSRSRTYIPAGAWNRVVNLSALSAIAVGFFHAYFLAMNSYFE
jgi:purine-cytosine permease-like protein